MFNADALFECLIEVTHQEEYYLQILITEYCSFYRTQYSIYTSNVDKTYCENEDTAAVLLLCLSHLCSCRIKKMERKCPTGGQTTDCVEINCRHKFRSFPLASPLTDRHKMLNCKIFFWPELLQRHSQAPTCYSSFTSCAGILQDST